MLKYPVLWLIKLYQYTLSPDHGLLGKLGLVKPACVFYPTCSVYTYEAIEKYGVVKGASLGLRRIWRCRPGTTPQVDPVPAISKDFVSR